MKRFIGMACLLSLILLPALALATPSVYPTGTTIYKPDKAWNGFTVLAGREGVTVDMNGNLVKTWPGVGGSTRRRKRFKAEQIVAILKEAERDGAAVADVCRAHGVSDATFYRWKKTYNGMDVREVRRLRQLEDENARLKRLVAERDLEIDAMKEVLRKNC